jgi:hypothetical protein
MRSLCKIVLCRQIVEALPDSSTCDCVIFRSEFRLLDLGVEGSSKVGRCQT